jgi:hypothetical protein
VADPPGGPWEEEGVGDNEPIPAWVTDPDPDASGGGASPPSSPHRQDRASSAQELLQGHRPSGDTDRRVRWLEAAGDLQAEVARRAAIADPVPPEAGVTFLVEWGLTLTTAEWLYGARKGRDWREATDGAGRVILLPLDSAVADQEPFGAAP